MAETSAQMMKVAHHIDQGPVTMYAVDANSAVSQHPLEWSMAPWSGDAADAARAARKERYDQEVARAKEAGLPEPAPLPPPPEPLTPAQQEEVSADEKARIEAAEIVRVRAEEDEKRRIDDEKVKAAKALLASSPQPVERRPFGRPGPLTPAERKALDKRTADQKQPTAGNVGAVQGDTNAVTEATGDKEAADRKAKVEAERADAERKAKNP